MSDEQPRWAYINLGLRPDQHAWLRERAYLDRLSIAELVRRFIDEGRERREPQQQLPLSE